jgi:hypothetical protein
LVVVVVVGGGVPAWAQAAVGWSTVTIGTVQMKAPA